jgi:uncharacterized integral membrane protein
LTTLPNTAMDSATGTSDRKARARTIAAGLLGVLLTLFAVLNGQSVRVHLLVSTVSMPLIVVIAVCSLLGVLIGWIVARRRAARRADRHPVA